MTVMERRLQLLLDQHRYALVATEADRSGRSVAAVIREAIDVRFDDGEARRAAGARRFLELTETPDAEPAEWDAAKHAMLEELDAKLGRAEQSAP